MALGGEGRDSVGKREGIAVEGEGKNGGGERVKEWKWERGK